MKAEVVVARRTPLLDQALDRVRAAVEAVLDFADAAAEKLKKGPLKGLGSVDQTK